MLHEIEYDEQYIGNDYVARFRELGEFFGPDPQLALWATDITVGFAD